MGTFYKFDVNQTELSGAKKQRKPYDIRHNRIRRLKR